MHLWNHRLPLNKQNKKKCVCWCVLTDTLGLICIAWLNCALRTFLSPSDDQISNESDELINSKQARSFQSRHTPLVAESSHHILTDYTALKSYFVNSFFRSSVQYRKQTTDEEKQLLKKCLRFKTTNLLLQTQLQRWVRSLSSVFVFGNMFLSLLRHSL